MDNAFISVLLFLINLLFTLFASVVLLRLLLQWVKADFYNPICQLLMKLSNPLLLPLRRIIPGFFGLDCAALLLVILSLALELSLILLITGPVPGYVFLITLGVKFLDLVLQLYFFAIIARALLSFSLGAAMNPAYIVLVQLTEPILRPVRRWIKPISGFDFSPLVLLVLIQAILIFVHRYLGA